LKNRLYILLTNLMLFADANRFISVIDAFIFAGQLK